MMSAEKKVRPNGYLGHTRRRDEGAGYTSRSLPRLAKLEHHGDRAACPVSVPVSLPPAPRLVIDSGVEAKFTRLRDQWLVESGRMSSTTEMVLLPSYQGIIGMGPAAVPLLLRELERSVDYWFWALYAITQVDPADPKDAGDWEAIAAAWLVWGKTQGYEW